MHSFSEFNYLLETTLLDEGLLSEISLSRVHAHMQNRNMGLITAHRGAHNFPGKTKAEVDALNKGNNQKLEASIKKAGYGYTKVRGRFQEGGKHPVDEHTFMVMGKKGPDGGKLHNFLKKHGKRYDQDSIIHKAHDSVDAHLTGTNHTGDVPFGKQAKLGPFHPNRAGMYHTVLHGGGPKSGKNGASKKTFAFED